jgi:hypothetical protein
MQNLIKIKEEAKKLGDLTLILNDLRFAIDILKRLLELLKNKYDDGVILESLWTTALIIYYRCFKHGKREYISTDIFKDKNLGGDPLGCHNYYFNMRSKHIAHSINPFEQIKLGLILTKDKKEIRGIEIFSCKLSYLGIEGIETFLRLVIIAEKSVCKKAKDSQDKLLQLSKEIPLKALPEALRLEIEIPGPNDVKKARE